MIDSNLEWLSPEDAAAYIKIGKTKLYDLAQRGLIPASKIDKKWVFQKRQIDEWLNSKQPMETYFKSLDADIESNERLREPQRDAYLNTFNFIQSGEKKAIIQLPVGCGKSGLASILPLNIAEGRVLILAPNLTIKDTLYDAMDITNRQRCFWRKTRVLSDSTLSAGPLVSTLESGNLSVAEKSHIVISNVQQLTTSVDKWLNQFPRDFFDLIIVDEAHHSAADSWKKVIEHFPGAKVIHLTATPFRSDRQEIDGSLVYRYSFKSATLKGYIKRLKAWYVAPETIDLQFTDQEGRTYSLMEVMQLKEEDWFSRNVALAKPCNEHIVDNSLSKLEELRMTGTRHQLIAVACSINHGKDVCAMYRERGYTAEVIHSKLNPEERDRIIRDLRNGTLDCIVQVQMLGEGFDHPKLSVAAIFRPFRSLAPYVQFVGRIMRVTVQNFPNHPDNTGHIVTHLGMNLDERLKEFKQFESDDQAFWEKVIGGEDIQVPDAVRSGDARKSADERDVVISGEIVDSLWGEDFADMDDKLIIQDLEERLRLLGLDPDMAKEMVKRGKSEPIQKTTASQPFPIQPQREWEVLKLRLHEQGPRLAKILLNQVGLAVSGVEIPFKYPSLKASSQNNLTSAIILINREINKRLGVERSQCTSDQFKAILNPRELDDILQTVARRVHKVMGEQDADQTEGTSPDSH